MELAPRRCADAVILCPAGRIDHTVSPDFKAALAPHLDRCGAERDRVVLDLSGVEYISSAGLRVLMLAAKQVKAQGGTMVVAALGPIVREIFEISRFHLVLDVYPTTRDALAAVSPAALAAFSQTGVG
ncbi:MAG: STAS domain-containing protein [Candidatus Rokubacteria bacterium]|nr:STAS domain-containing protein [Candidatus Rokubacteria bacterium]